MYVHICTLVFLPFYMYNVHLPYLSFQFSGKCYLSRNGSYLTNYLMLWCDSSWESLIIHSTRNAICTKTPHSQNFKNRFSKSKDPTHDVQDTISMNPSWRDSAGLKGSSRSKYALNYAFLNFQPNLLVFFYICNIFPYCSPLRIVATRDYLKP